MRMRASRNRRKGFTLIELLIVMEIVLILMAMAIPSIVNSRRSADEASAIGSLRTMNAVESTYRTKNGVFGTLAQLQTGKLVDPLLGNASAIATAKAGYYFTITPVAPGSSQYWIIGLATNAQAGSRQFYTDETGVIFQAANNATVAAADSSGQAPAAGWTTISN